MSRFTKLGMLAAALAALWLALGAGMQGGEEKASLAAGGGAAKAKMPELAAGRGRPDPFAPLPVARALPVGPALALTDEPSADAQAVRLTGIVWSAVRPLAVINEALVGVDDTVCGWRVVAIDRCSVDVEMSGVRETLKINSPGLDNRSGRDALRSSD